MRERREWTGKRAGILLALALLLAAGLGLLTAGRARAARDARVKVTFTLENSWSSGEGQRTAQYSATIVNGSSRELTSWRIHAPVGSAFALSGSWCASFSSDGTDLWMEPLDWNARIAAGGSCTGIGFQIQVQEAEFADFSGTYAVDDVTYGASGAGGTGSAARRIQSGGDALWMNFADLRAAAERRREAEQAAEEEKRRQEQAAIEAQERKTSPVAVHGKLSVKGTQLVDQKGRAYALRGVSTHGIAWFPQYVAKDTFRTLRDDWHAGVVRLAMYTQESGGYCSGGDRRALKKRIDTGVSACTDLGLYCIIDWHILSDGNPLTHQKEAVAFFTEMAKKYASHNNVIYEICNEPNGGTSWNTIRGYANTVIAAIRKYDSDAIILVGTPTWSQDVDQVIGHEVSQKKNVMYTLHFYAATHKEDLRRKAQRALSAGIPLFVSEFGICDASGAGSIDYASANAWKDFLRKNQISSCAWSLCNKNETASLIKSGVKKTSGWSTAELSASGQWVRNLCLGK